MVCLQKHPRFFSLFCAAFSLLFFLLSGCTTGLLKKNTENEIILPARPCNKTFRITGRVSVQYTHTFQERSESLHGKFSWEQQDGHARIDLASPLGQILAVMTLSPQQAIFAASGKPPVAAADADALFFQQMGWPLPVSELAHWLQGCAVQSDGTLFNASPQQAEIHTQNGWRIRYVDWMSLSQNSLAPRRIDMTYLPQKEAPISHISLRFVIDEWLPAS